MHLKFVKRFLLSLSFIVAAGGSAWAQTAVNTSSSQENIPYTRYGIGDLRNTANVSVMGMGSITAAYAADYAVNPENPASYASLKLVAYQAAVGGSTHTLQTGGNKYSTGTATLSYLNIGIPLAKGRGGLAIGLKPMSNVYYKLADTIERPGLNQNSNIYSGEGGLNFAYLGGAVAYGGLVWVPISGICLARFIRPVLCCISAIRSTS